MAFGTPLDLLALGAESTPGTPVTPTVAVRWRNIDFKPSVPMEGESFATGDFGKSEKYAQERTGQISGYTYLSLPPAVGTAPDWSAVFAMGGLARTAHGSTGQSWTGRAGAGAIAPYTAYMLAREEGATPQQLAMQMKGVMGGVKIIAAKRADVIRIDFNGQGAWYGAADIANGSLINLGTVNTATGMQLLGWSCALHGYTARLDAFEIDTNPSVEALPNQADSQSTGIDYFRVTDMAAKAKLTIELPRVASFDWRSRWVAGTIGSMTLSNQGSAATLFQARAPRAQIVDCQLKTINGAKFLDVSLEFLRNGSSDATMNADDMIEFLHGSKT